MSGPPYPHPNPAPGSNAIGFFQIGVSPIGTISPFDVWKTVMMQYANDPVGTDMILAFNAALDQTQNMDDFFDLVWNVDTAEGYGLDVWGRIVNVSRTIEVPGSQTFLGNEEAGSWTGFGQGGFYTGGAVTTNYSFADADYRRLILAKAQSNITDGSIPSFNQILLNLFPARGKCYVADGLNMTMTLTFNFALSPVDLAIVQSSGVLPIPAGVVVNIVQL